MWKPRNNRELRESNTGESQSFRSIESQQLTRAQNVVDVRKYGVCDVDGAAPYCQILPATYTIKLFQPKKNQLESYLDNDAWQNLITFSGFKYM